MPHNLKKEKKINSSSWTRSLILSTVREAHGKTSRSTDIITHLSVVGFHQPSFDNVTVHVNQAEKVQAHWWSQAAQKHARKDQTVFVGLMMRCQIVQIEYADLENR